MRRVDAIRNLTIQPEDQIDVATIIHQAFRAGVHFGKRDKSNNMPSSDKIMEALDEWYEEPVPDTYLSGSSEVPSRSN